ncbi:MAG: MBL fold metallo-hydrolase, partial [Eubacteriales bacterium]|nr:MBL fold metallo-hydrolase [Eubacteriales bacterium]
GSRIFMNPDEMKKRADLRHCYLSDAATRTESLRTVGVTPEHTPEVYKTILEYTERAHEQWGSQQDFDFIPTPPGTVLDYGQFHFQVVPLRGHTNGQCGLYEPEHRLFFCGDQIMTDIVPIVCTQYKNWGMLKSYLNSLDEMKHKYADCRFLSAHGGPIRDICREADRVILGYMDKCMIMKHVLEENGGKLTTRDVGVRAYGRSLGPPDYQHFMSCTQIWVKTFSCLEYLYGEGFIRRSEKDGILYWEALHE